MPSPRMLHVLKRGQAPLTVVNNEREDEPWSVPATKFIISEQEEQEIKMTI